jgi:hypothetical protein
MGDTTVERTVTITVGADAAYAYLSDPLHLADFVPTLEHVETDVVEGTEPVAAAGEAPPGARPARFHTDNATRTVEWDAPGAGLALRMTVGEGTSLTSRLTVVLQAAGEPEPSVLEDLVDRIVANLRRSISGRR